MQVVEKKKEALYRNYELVIPHDELKRRVDKYLVSVGTKIQGFRKVKDVQSLSDTMVAARSANLRRIHRDQLPSIYKDVVKECVFDQIRDEKIAIPAYNPEISFDANNVDESTDLKVNVEFEVYPEDVKAEISIDSATKYIAKISDDYVEQKIAEEAKNAVRYIDAEKEDLFTENDVAVIDMFATYKDEENTLLENFQADSKNLTPDFFGKILGKKAGENIVFDVKMPEDFSGNVHARKIAGKVVGYRIVIKSIKKKSNFEVNDDFAKACRFENLDKMREGFKKILQQNADQSASVILNKEISDKIAECLKFEVPKKILEAQKEQLASSNQISPDKSIDSDVGHNVEVDSAKKKTTKKPAKSTVEKSEINIDEEALKKARFAIFMSHYISENIKISDDEIRIAYLMTGKKGDYNSIKNALSDMKFREEMIKKVKKLEEKELTIEELEKIAENQ